MKKLVAYNSNVLYYNNVNLLDIVEKYKAPLKITFLDITRSRVQNLKKAFDEVIKEENYPGKFYYYNANKANYGVEEITTAVKASDGVECSSYNDLLLTKAILEKNNMKDCPIYCNGFKNENYLKEIADTYNAGWNIVSIVDCMYEYEYFKEHVKKEFEIGIRIHLRSLYSEDGVVLNDRFGVMHDEYEAIINDLKKHKEIKLTTIHFHQRGFDFEKDKFVENLSKAYEYYVNARKIFDTVVNFDIGGGTPLPAEKDYDYKEFARIIIQTIKNHKEVPYANIISENGKYSQKDSCINIYEVAAVKNTDEQYPWYIVDASLMIALPEYFALGEPIPVVPLNLLGNEKIKARLCGMTCDCDDVYYDKSLGYMMLPKINKGEKLYICCLGTGSYQDSMNGRGGVHHCLIPQERELYSDIVDGKRVFKVHKDVQNIEDIKKILQF